MKFDKLIKQIEKINSDLQLKALQSVNQALTIRNWMIGHHIYEYEQGGQDRAKYGEKLLLNIAKEFSRRYCGTQSSYKSIDIHLATIWQPK